ncbi:MAG: polyprenol monophosphomannose synthase [Chitinophagaceae bacterium]|nr:polyprenol monophosphomannose synthase [Chitinophagaceae bacterium]
MVPLEKYVIIIPTYNEKDNVGEIIEHVFGLKTFFHILIIDDGSPDGTVDIVKKKMGFYSERLFLIQREGKQGLGTAYIRGFSWALERNYEYIFEMDCDFSHNPSDTERLLETCINGCDLAIGSRYVKRLVNVINWPISRLIMSYYASAYVRFITGIPIMDTTAGFKCYKRKVLETIPLHEIAFVGYAFQIEMKFTAWKYGFKIQEVPIIFTDRSKGESKMSKGIFREAVFGVIYMKVMSFFKKYNL